MLLRGDCEHPRSRCDRKRLDVGDLALEAARRIPQLWEAQLDRFDQFVNQLKQKESES